MGACLGDAIFVESPSGDRRVALHAWASAKVPNGRVALSDQARMVLLTDETPDESNSDGSWLLPALAAPAPLLSGALRVSLARSGALPPAARLDVCVLHAEDGYELDDGLGVQEGDRLQWVSDQMLGWPVAERCVLPMRLQGRPLPLRVVAAVAAVAAPASAAAAVAAAAPPPADGLEPVLLVTSETRIALVEAPPPAFAALDGSGTPSSPPPPALTSSPPAEALFIAGMDELITQLREAVELPLFQQALFERLGVPPPTGVLMHGPPGTGKTLLARVVCHQLGVHVQEVSASSILASSSGDAEARLSAAFAEARARSPSVLFFDEIDGLGASRDAAGGGGGDARLLAVLLTEMDGVRSYAPATRSRHAPAEPSTAFHSVPRRSTAFRSLPQPFIAFHNLLAAPTADPRRRRATRPCAGAHEPRAHPRPRRDQPPRRARLGAPAPRPLRH